MTFTEDFLAETVAIVQALDRDSDRGAGRPGSPRSASARRPAVHPRRRRLGRPRVSHAVNDFRKICGFEAYAPTDNVSELTARTNDEGWDTTFCGVARGLAPRRRRRAAGVLGRRRRRRDATSRPTSSRALELATSVGASSSASSAATAATPPSSPTPCVVIPPLFPDHITPHTEGLCACLAPAGQPPRAASGRPTKWESRRT